MPKPNKDEICKHCNCLIKIRNPSGFCDHLYYPENCRVCSEENHLARVVHDMPTRHKPWDAVTPLVTCESPELAQEIAKRWNAYDTLTAQNRIMREALRACEYLLGPHEWYEGAKKNPKKDMLVSALLSRIREALKKVGADE